MAMAQGAFNYQKFCLQGGKVTLLQLSKYQDRLFCVESKPNNFLF